MVYVATFLVWLIWRHSTSATSLARKTLKIKGLHDTQYNAVSYRSRLRFRHPKSDVSNQIRDPQLRHSVSLVNQTFSSGWRLSIEDYKRLLESAYNLEEKGVWFTRLMLHQMNNLVIYVQSHYNVPVLVSPCLLLFVRETHLKQPSAWLCCNTTFLDYYKTICWLEIFVKLYQSQSHK